MIIRVLKNKLINLNKIKNEQSFGHFIAPSYLYRLKLDLRY